MEKTFADHLSWWEEEYLLSDIDYTIIGAGIVGISTALELLKWDSKLKILILDKLTFPIGASTKNAGFACFGSISEIVSDMDTYGKEDCRELIEMRWKGLKLLKNRTSNADIDYEDKYGIEIFENREAEEFYESKIEEVNQLIKNIIGIDDCFFTRNGKFGFEIINRLEGCLNPQKMMTELEPQARSQGVRCIFGVSVDKIHKDGNYLSTDLGKISYRHLIVCTNGFSRKLLPEVDVIPARNQVILTTPIENFKLDGCYHMNKGFVYFREIGSRLLIGGGRHLDIKGETTTSLDQTEKIVSYLENIACSKILKGFEIKIDKKWSGILGVGSNKKPIVKNIAENVTIAVRMGGMGIAIGSLMGKMIAMGLSKETAL